MWPGSSCSRTAAWKGRAVSAAPCAVMCMSVRCYVGRAVSAAWACADVMAASSNGLFVCCPQARDPKTSRVYIVAQARLPSIPGAVPKENKKAKEG